MCSDPLTKDQIEKPKRLDHFVEVTRSNLEHGEGYNENDEVIVWQAQRIKELEAAYDESRKDSERIDFIEDSGLAPIPGVTNPRDGGIAEEYWRVGNHEASFLRHAIDDAKAALPAPALSSKGEL